ELRAGVHSVKLGRLVTKALIIVETCRLRREVIAAEWVSAHRLHLREAAHRLRLHFAAERFRRHVATERVIAKAGWLRRHFAAAKRVGPEARRLRRHVTATEGIIAKRAGTFISEERGRLLLLLAAGFRF